MKAKKFLKLTGLLLAGVLWQAPELAAKPFTYAYEKPKNPELIETYEWARDVDLLQQLPEVNGMDEMFKLPRNLSFVMQQCDDENAFYDPETAQVILCHELVKSYIEQAYSLKDQGGQPADIVVTYVILQTRLTLLHEMGHALVDLLDLPITGREEDAADQLAAIIMLRYAQDPELSQEASYDFGLASLQYSEMSDTADYGDSDFADTHSLGQQRYFTFLCIVYGSDTKTFASFVGGDGLPQARAEGCEWESWRATHAWDRLLEPYYVNP